MFERAANAAGLTRRLSSRWGKRPAWYPSAASDRSAEVMLLLLTTSPDLVLP